MSRKMVLPALVASLVILTGSQAFASGSLFSYLFGSPVVRSCDPCNPVEPCVAVKACEKAAPAVCEKAAPAVCEKAAPAVCEKVAPPACEKAAPAVCEKAAPAVCEKATPAVCDKMVVAPLLPRLMR